MLLTLDIRDMLIIDRLELAFQPGLNALTGETGAGKSILLDSLGFVLGWRGRAALVRAGAAQGEVVAEFALPEGHAAHAVLAEAGLPGGETLLLRRVNSADGRKTAWVNDRRVSGEVLRALSETLVELHGQQDDKGLLNPREHRRILDRFASNDSARAAVADAWKARRSAAKALEEARASLSEVAAEEEFLRHAVTELDALDPQPGEADALDSERRLAQAAARIREDVARALGALSETAEPAMGEALRWLEGAADEAEDLLAPPMAAIDRAFNELSDATQGVQAALDQLGVDPARLEACEERLFALRGLARKHGVQPDELAALTEDLRTRLDRLDAGEAHIDALEKQARAAEAAYTSAAATLSESRAAAAGKLDAAVMAELAPLKMERAVFATALGAAEPGPEGTDEVSFTVATNPGAPAGPLAKIASGGELSRFLLALKVVLAEPEAGITMIFDEIDRGVGGATADAVGKRLEAIAAVGQVLVVTHSPQVAARAAHQWRVAKRVEEGVTLSSVVLLSEEERVDEIARMVAGDTVTEAARAAARALL